MEHEKIKNTKIRLIKSVKNIFEDEVEKNTACSSQIRRVLDLMETLEPDPDQPQQPEAVPGCRHLSQLLDMAETGPAAAVGAAIRELEPTLVWAQNPRYNAENKGADFMDNYGWSALGLISSSKMSFGVLMLGPGLTYPPTSYESEGVFLVISGSPEWKSGDAPWVRVESGDIICRPFGGAEGKRPGTKPMLALYAWMYK
tara:strand:- start:1689 stop:2288 length:600 start_codon:yes stop_codon:yes gene_type:complete